MITLKQALEMSYEEYVSHLLKKYGPAKANYFLNENCKSKGKISRTKEGLECHHIDEDKEQLLSDPRIAVINPFEYQKANRLVYCDKVEHLLIHIKIIEEFRPQNEWYKYYMDGPRMIISCINDYFKDDIISTSWHGNMKQKIIPKFNSYIFILFYILFNLAQTKISSNNILDLVLVSYYGRADKRISLALEKLTKIENHNEILNSTEIDL